jgi:hypothetical protein
MAHTVKFREGWQTLSGSIASVVYSDAVFSPSGTMCALVRQSGDIELWDMGSFPVCMDQLALDIGKSEEQEVGEMEAQVVSWGDCYIASAYMIKEVRKTTDKSSKKPVVKESIVKVWQLDYTGMERPKEVLSVSLPFVVAHISFSMLRGTAGAEDGMGMALNVVSSDSQRSHVIGTPLPHPSILLQITWDGQQGVGAAAGRPRVQTFFAAPGEVPCTPEQLGSTDAVAKWYKSCHFNAAALGIVPEMVSFCSTAHVPSCRRTFVLASKTSLARDAKALMLYRADYDGSTSAIGGGGGGGDAVQYASSGEVPHLSAAELRTLTGVSMDCIMINNSKSCSSSKKYYNLACSCLVLVTTPCTAVIVDGDSFAALRRLMPMMEALVLNSHLGAFKKDTLVGAGFTGLTFPFDRPDPNVPAGPVGGEEDTSTLGVVIGLRNLSDRKADLGNNRMYVWRPFASYSARKEKPTELSLAPAFHTPVPEPAADGLDPSIRSVDESIFPCHMGVLVIKPSPKSVVLSIDVLGNAWYYSRTMQSSFPGIAYPPGYAYMMRVTSYAEKEDELDKEVRNPKSSSDSEWDESEVRPIVFDVPSGSRGGMEQCLRRGLFEDDDEGGIKTSFVGSEADGRAQVCHDRTLDNGHVVRLVKTQEVALVPALLPMPKCVSTGEKQREVLKRRTAQLEILASALDDKHLQAKLQVVREDGRKKIEEAAKRQKLVRTKREELSRRMLSAELARDEGFLTRKFEEEKRRRLATERLNAATAAAAAAAASAAAAAAAAAAEEEKSMTVVDAEADAEAEREVLSVAVAVAEGKPDTQPLTAAEES